MRFPLQMLPWLLAFGSCSSPPKPPTVDESDRRPANTAQAVELQSCRGELQNTRILASEANRAAEAAAVIATRLHERQQVLAALTSSGPTAATGPANAIYTVHFDFIWLGEGTRVRVTTSSDTRDPWKCAKHFLLPSAAVSPLQVLNALSAQLGEEPKAEETN